MSNAEWNRTIAVNLSGVFYCSKAALVPMMKAQSGCIVNISSQSARRGSKGLSPAYNASKDGVLGLTAAFAEQVTEFGIRVKAVPLSLVASRDFGRTPAVREERAREYPLGLGTPKDVGEAVLYLASSAARWVSGTSLHLTGGTQQGSSVLSSPVGRLRPSRPSQRASSIGSHPRLNSENRRRRNSHRTS